MSLYRAMIALKYAYLTPSEVRRRCPASVRMRCFLPRRAHGLQHFLCHRRALLGVSAGSGAPAPADRPLPSFAMRVTAAATARHTDATRALRARRREGAPLLYGAQLRARHALAERPATHLGMAAGQAAPHRGRARHHRGEARDRCPSSVLRCCPVHRRRRPLVVAVGAPRWRVFNRVFMGPSRARSYGDRGVASLRKSVARESLAAVVSTW